MTKKDFELIAAVLNNYHLDTPIQKQIVAAVAREFADRLKATNKQFNRDKFLRACGVCPNA